jgi:DNA-binding NarL/FixJ family response regulator
MLAASAGGRHADPVSENADVRVLVVDDQRPFRLAAASVLRRTPGFVLAGEVESGEAAVTVAKELRPDLVLMDIRMPGVDGIEATKLLLAELPSTVVFLCSTYERPDLPVDAAESGAAAYIHKEELRPELLTELWLREAPRRTVPPDNGG